MHDTKKKENISHNYIIVTNKELKILHMVFIDFKKVSNNIPQTIYMG